MLQFPELQADPAGAALVLFSAGQDSSIALAWALQRFRRVETIGFAYGQRHAVEMQSRPQMRAEIASLAPEGAARLGPDHVVDLSSFGALAASALTREEPITEPEGALPNTFVPGRNIVFFTYAAALAAQRGLDVLVGGMCEADFSGYPDCRADTLEAAERTLQLALALPTLQIATPLMHLTKAQSWALARRLGGEALVELVRVGSHTCYLGVRDVLHAWGFGCAACPACVLRARGWADYAGGGAAAATRSS
ncbi:MAG: 7-cyano-7-deazaguanine synthase QueC [Hyphomonadaceae bacterium]|nr:7-cyano-7-deazaguanine synthase QueC [Hyphomonadaceae bacterium]